MAKNLFGELHLWSDGQYNDPPSSLYDAETNSLKGDVHGGLKSLYYQGPMDEGDYIEFTVVTLDVGEPNPTVSVYNNDDYIGEVGVGETARFSAFNPYSWVSIRIYGGCSGGFIEIIQPPVVEAVDDEATTNVGVPVIVDILANDTYGSNPVQLSDLDGLPEIIQEPSSGTVEVLDDGRVVYTPAEGFSGEVEFQYRIKTPEPEICYNLSLDNGHLYDWNIEDSEIPGFIMGEEMYLINDQGIIYNYVYYSGSNYYAPTSDYPQCGTLPNWKIVFPRDGDYDDMVELCVNIENGCA